jgi:glutamate transport system substrate-binding protein
MKRRNWGVAALLTLAVLSAACASKNDNPAVSGGATTTTAGPASLKVPTFAAGSTMATLQQKGKIVLGTKFDQPLFGLKDPVSGKVQGFDVEIAKMIAQGIFGGTAAAAESKIDFVETVSKNREPFIEQGKVDIVVATYTINDTRKQVVDFAGPYYIAGQDIMVKKGDSTIKGVADLAGKKVCSVTGSTSIKNVQQQAPTADVSTSFDKYSLCAEALADGRVQAVTTDNVILLGLIKDNPDKFQLVKNTFTTEPYGIGLKKGDDAFRTFLNDRLDTIFKNGEWKAAFKATVGQAGAEAGSPEPPKIDRYTATPAAPTTTAAGGGGGATTTSTSSKSTTSTPTTVK